MELTELSQEQNNLVSLIVKGLRNIEIAEEMGLSESSIKKRLTAIYRQFNVPDRLSLVKKVIYMQSLGC